MSESVNIGNDNENAFYDGSRIFMWLSDIVGLPIDQVNFLISQFTCLIFGFVYRHHFHPDKVSTTARHTVALALGLLIGFFCFGRHALHLVCLATLSYILMLSVSPKISHHLVLVASLLYLSGVHIRRQLYNYGSYTLDISGPLMVITQKMSSLAFSLHDGLTRKEEDLTPYQKEQVIKKYPKPLEFFSYAFHFQALMCGPTVLYADYMDFINGQNYAKKISASLLDKNSNNRVSREPSAFGVVMKKAVGSIVCALLFVKLVPEVPIQRVKEEVYLAKPVWYQTWYLVVATTVVRMKYYHAWLLADAICNASGLGFNGYTVQGEARWDLISNIDIKKFELGLSLKDSIDHWNKCTTRWLRFIVYERAPVCRTVLTYCLSAVWHGFYPGYYLTFLGGAIFTVASRSVRRSIRPFFMSSKSKKFLYDIATCLMTRVALGYVTFSFVLLEFWPSIRLYQQMYFWLHILSVFAIFVLPVILPPRSARPRDAKMELVEEKVVLTPVKIMGEPVIESQENVRFGKSVHQD